MLLAFFLLATKSICNAFEIDKDADLCHIYSFTMGTFEATAKSTAALSKIVLIYP